MSSPPASPASSLKGSSSAYAAPFSPTADKGAQLEDSFSTPIQRHAPGKGGYEKLVLKSPSDEGKQTKQVSEQANGLDQC